MDFKATFTERVRRIRRSGFTLLEMLFTMGITTLCMSALTLFYVFTTHSFATLFNYVDLDDANRIAMDQLTRDIRQSDCITGFTTNQLTLQDGDGLALSWSYDSTSRSVTRVKQNSSTNVLLTDCDALSFDVRQRNVVGGSYDVYPIATNAATAKVVNVYWTCSRKIFGHKEDTESVQTARIVIRKQGS